MGRKKGKGDGTESPQSIDKYANELQILIDNLDLDDYVEGIGPLVIDWFKDLEVFSSETIKACLTYGKTLRNAQVENHYRTLLPIFEYACSKIRERDSEIYDLKNLVSDAAPALLKAKIWSLERENEALKAKLEIYNDISSTVREITPVLEELKENNIKDLLRAERELVCKDINSTNEKSNLGILEEVKSSSSKSYAQIALQSRGISQNSSIPIRPLPISSQDPEGVLLIKPKNDRVKDFDTNKKLFMNLISSNNPNARVRGINKLYGGGVKIITGSTDEADAIKDLILEKGAADLDQNFEFVLPGRRVPQIILYNVDKGVGEESLKKGLLSKNITLADAENKPHFKIDFKIPARDPKCNHWVLSINPKKYSDFIGKGGFYFEFTKLRLSEFISVKQCKVCFGFGHTSKNCDHAENPRCEKCGEAKKEGHKCRTVKCVNCIESNERFRTDFRTNHSCLDRRCRSYQKQKELVIKRTNYG
ncbi:hypothetical protein AVEN_47894-1 [Araneus ventricosus]|uniref:CCHC-type domain-containing protein n=1 Tax=Araneus ventricosus TaxID=182803 RepID=A0A4Y2QKW4_ARAVE|nr:hypothetical protein AVEN_47894-1 [Araneus ventricosus]